MPSTTCSADAQEDGAHMDMELLRANLLRTLVPILVGAVVTVLPKGLGATEQLTVLIGFGVSYLYYAVFRIAETRYPRLGVFLGKKMPTHQSPKRPTGEPRAATLLGTGEVEPGSGLDVRVDGVPLPAVESVAWHVRPDGTPMLRVEMAVADVAVAVSGTPGPASPAAGSAPPRPAS